MGTVARELGKDGADTLARQRALELMELVADTHKQYWNGLFRMRQQGDSNVDDVRARLKLWVWFSRRFPRLIANVHARCPVFEVRRGLVHNMYEEEVMDHDLGNYHVGQQIKEAVAMGVSEEELADPENLTPTVIACLEALDNLSRTRTWQEGLAAVACLELTNTQMFRDRTNLPSISSIQHKLPRPDLVKSSLHHESKDEDHGIDELEDLCRYIESDAHWEAVKRTTREASMVFALLLEGVYKHIRTEDPF